MAPVTVAVFVLGLLVIVVASAFVVVPLLRPALAAAPAEQRSDVERWERQKRQALAAIKEAELDHRMGKLSDEDLAAMRGRFEAQALEAMAALDKRSRKGLTG